MNIKKLLLACLMCAVTCNIMAQRYIEQQTERTLRSLKKGVTKELADSRRANISDVHYDLTFNIPANPKQDVTGLAVISFVLAERSDVVLDFQGQFSGTCIINDKKRVAPYQEEHIVLPMKFLNPGLNIVAMNFVCANTALNRHANYMYTLFVPDHARSCFPCFDQPDLRAMFSTTLNVPEGWKTMVSDCETPLPTYLYSFVAGQFNEKTDQRDGRPMRALYLETDPQKTEQLDRIFEEANNALNWMESYTGIKCPFAEYGIVILPGYQFGGMEHPGAIQLNDRRLFLGQNPSQEE